MKFRDYFDRISIINLVERSDRREEMVVELANAGMQPEPGRIEFFAACRPKDKGGFDSIGFHGCFLSHLGVYTQAHDSGAKRVLVMEDDAAFSPRFRQDEESLVAELQNLDWGIVFFGHAFEPTDDSKPTHIRALDHAVMGSHFYAVNGPILPRLIDFFEKTLARPAGHPDGGPMSPDGALALFLQRNLDVKSYRTTPNFGTQRSSRSDVSPKWFDNVPGLKQMASLLRKVKRQIRR